MKSGTLSSQMNIAGKNIVKMRLPVVQFQDNGTEVIYCPALNVYGYGLTSAEAVDSLEISIEEFFTYTLRKKTLGAELEKLGWVIRRSHKYRPPLFSSLIEKNKVLHKIMNTRPFYKTDHNFAIPAVS